MRYACRMSDAGSREVYLEHRRDEADSAFLSRVLAEAEPDSSRREIYRRLAEVEDRHTAVWEKLLKDDGMLPPPSRPSARARVLALLARRFGPALLTTLMLREEGREVKGYLVLHRASRPGALQDAAERLARESAEHAETLRSLAGTTGEPWHQAGTGGFLRNVVYGFNDGLTANFGLVAGVIGAAASPHAILVAGFSGLVADALSMGSSGYLAAKSEQEVYEHEVAMEADEIRLMPEVEAEEMALLYQAKGASPDEARRMAAEILRDPERALREQVREELGFGEHRVTPLEEGLVTGTATVVGAFLPVAPFLLLHGAPAAWTSFTLSMLLHFVVGAARSVFTGRGLLRSGVDMFLVGLGVAAVGYAVGDVIARLF